MSSLSLLCGWPAVDLSGAEGWLAGARDKGSAGACCLTGPRRVPETSNLMQKSGNLHEKKLALACKVCTYLCHTHVGQRLGKAVLKVT